jgi:D-alanyl-D-alanine-carboxypeptidase/D-alanyl-D-alanine-endopeptidase
MSHPKFLRILSVFYFVFPCLSACAQGLEQTLISSPQSVDALGSDLFLQSGTTGMVIVVVHGNQVSFHGYGETAPNSHQVPTQDSLLRLCSLTKIFTTDVLTKLVADHTVELDDPLQHFASVHVLVPKRVKPITLADLATHTSGLSRELGNAPRDTPHFTFPDYHTRWRWLPNQRLRSTPGAAALYSNVGFDLLSDALQASAHKQYAALLAERTLNPLHMQYTTYFPSEAQCSRLLIGAHDEGACAVTEATAGSSGLYSTASDMAIWTQYLLGIGGGPGTPSQESAAQAVQILSDPISATRLQAATRSTPGTVIQRATASASSWCCSSSCSSPASSAWISASRKRYWRSKLALSVGSLLKGTRHKPSP